MTDDRSAVERFLDRTDAAFAEYERGYADADATLRVIESHVEDLREAVEEDVAGRAGRDERDGRE